MPKKRTIKKHDSLLTLRQTLSRKEFWVGLATTLIVLLVAVKLIPWNKMHTLMTNKTTVLSPLPTQTMEKSIATATPKTVELASAKMVTPIPATGSALKKTVNTLADTSGLYTVQEGDNYYKIAVTVCGNGSLFESIQAENNYAALYAGNQIRVTCSE